jgi:hypothetical protein
MNGGRKGPRTGFVFLLLSSLNLPLCLADIKSLKTYRKYTVAALLGGAGCPYKACMQGRLSASHLLLLARKSRVG